jgi:ribosome-associated translation inhibitor RaiA
MTEKIRKYIDAEVEKAETYFAANNWTRLSVTLSGRTF